MANVYATKSGNWSDTTLWNTAALPTTVDDVFAAGSTIFVDQNIQVLSINTRGTTGIGGGGTFRPNDGTILTTNVFAGSSTCITFASAAPSNFTLIGNVSGGNAGTPYGIVNNSTGTVNISGNILAGTLTNAFGFLNNSTGTVNITGSCYGGTGISSYGFRNASTGTVNITGNIYGNTSSSWGGENNGAGVVTIYGNVYGSNTTSNSYGYSNNSTGTTTIYGNVSANLAIGLQNNSSGTVNIIGNIYAGTGANIHGASNSGSSTGSINVFGNVNGGSGSSAYGILNNSSGIIVINGNAIAGTGTTTYGAFNNATGFLLINGTAIGNDFGLGSSGIQSVPGIFGSQTGTTIVRSLCCGVRGQWPTAGNVFIVPQNTSTATLFTSASAAQVLFTSLSTNIVPPASSVRLGTRYNLNDYTGTCVIPSISSVLQGVAVDNSVGIAALQPRTIWNYSVLSATDVDSLGGRLKEVATVQSVGQQLTALN